MYSVVKSGIFFPLQSVHPQSAIKQDYYQIQWRSTGTASTIDKWRLCSDITTYARLIVWSIYDKQPVFKVALKTLTDIEVPLINQHNISKLRNHSVKKKVHKNKTWKNMTNVSLQKYMIETKKIFSTQVIKQIIVWHCVLFSICCQFKF